MKLVANKCQNNASFSRALCLAIALGAISVSAPALAESESGGFVWGGGNQSGGFVPVGRGSGNETGGVLWGDGSSESGGATMSGAESDSGGMVEVGNSSETAGPLMVGSNDENKLIVRTYRW
ncbi:MAG: hypothetical protein P4L53_25695 [Candidatus Obscuribacterales bacterium]|nr:hypothetical protein [Candidatus Obscuribacterales bacterium]